MQNDLGFGFVCVWSFASFKIVWCTCILACAWLSAYFQTGILIVGCLLPETKGNQSLESYYM